jgi:hypothetical protein
MSRNSDDRCANCTAYARDAVADNGTGECRARPPQVIAAAGRNPKHVVSGDHQSVWPRVCDSDWCRKHARKP